MIVSATLLEAHKKTIKDSKKKDNDQVACIFMCIFRIILIQIDTKLSSAWLWKWLKNKYGKNIKLDVLYVELQVDLLQYWDSEDF